MLVAAETLRPAGRTDKPILPWRSGMEGRTIRPPGPRTRWDMRVKFAQKWSTAGTAMLLAMLDAPAPRGGESGG